MGRKSRLKREWRRERLAKRLDAGEFEPPPPSPLSFYRRYWWTLGVVLAWAISFISLAIPGYARVGAIPFLLVTLGSAHFERRRGRNRVATAWLVGGTLWLAAVLWSPPEVLGLGQASGGK